MEPNQTNTETIKPRPPRKRNVPQGDKQFSEAYDLAVAEWKKRPQLTLQWVTQAQAEAIGTRLREGIREASAARDAVTPQSKRLAELDALIDGKEGKLKYVKKALALQYDQENDGRPYYGEFGMEKVNSTYTLPRDRGERAAALTKLTKALALPKHNLSAGKYGLAFWQPIATEYNALQPKVAKDTGTRATEVGGKNRHREEAEDVFVSLLLLLEANYPKTYKAERRKFGVLKESY